MNFEIPAHVPSELVRDYDYTDLAGETDLFAHAARLHQQPDFFYTPRHGGHWVATRYVDQDAILFDHENFSSEYSSLPKNPFRLPLLESDEPMHSDYRNLLAPFFIPKRIALLEAKARALTNSLIDAIYANGECDFTRDFGQKMPIMILMNLLDLPEADTPYLLQLSEEIVRGGKPEVLQAAYGKLAMYIATQVLPARRAKPGDDIFSALLAGTVQGGRKLTDEELCALGCLLIGAGLDTVASMLGFVAMFLARHPAHRRALIEHPERLNESLEELMRRHCIANVSRVVVRDQVYKGIALKQGDVIQLPTPASGIDARHYPNAWEVDFERKDRRSLVFGRGPHQCIGAFLARTELRVFLQEWLRRIPDFDIKPGEQPVVISGKANAVMTLPLVWTIAAAA